MGLLYSLCECCGEAFTSRQLEIYHRNHNEGDNRRENLVVICKKCHDMIHQQEGGLRNKSQEDVSDLEYGDINKRLCHNKQLINSHFYRGVSELPYKLEFESL